MGNQTSGGHELAEMARERVQAGATELWFPVPATDPRDHVLFIGPDGAAVRSQGASEDIDAHALAERRLQAARDQFRGLGVAVGGGVGDEDPFGTEAADELDVTRRFVRKLVGEGNLDAVRVSTRLVRIRGTGLEGLLHPVLPPQQRG